MSRKVINGLEASLEALNKIDNEVVEMVERCQVCGDVLEGKVEVTGKGICKDCLEEIKIIEEDKMNKEWVEMNIKKERLEAGIRNAIIAGRVELNDKAKCITARELRGIINEYKIVTGFDMSDEQINALKKLNGTQAYYVSLTTGKALSAIRRAEREKRYAKANA